MAGRQPSKGGPGVPVNVAALKAARERKGWSQKRLAHEIGSDARVIERIESRGTASIQTLADIAEVLEVDPQSLRPSVVADFTGREDEIRRMVERLRGAGGKVGLSALRGMGGVGKT